MGTESDKHPLLVIVRFNKMRIEIFNDVFRAKRIVASLNNLNNSDAEHSTGHTAFCKSWNVTKSGSALEP
jgi:hypothetical protein